MLKLAAPQGSMDQGQEGEKSTVRGNQARMFRLTSLFELFLFCFVLLGFICWLIGCCCCCCCCGVDCFFFFVL